MKRKQRDTYEVYVLNLKETQESKKVDGDRIPEEFIKDFEIFWGRFGPGMPFIKKEELKVLHKKYNGEIDLIRRWARENLEIPRVEAFAMKLKANHSPDEEEFFKRLVSHYYFL